MIELRSEETTHNLEKNWQTLKSRILLAPCRLFILFLLRNFDKDSKMQNIYTIYLFMKLPGYCSPRISNTQKFNYR